MPVREGLNPARHRRAEEHRLRFLLNIPENFLDLGAVGFGAQRCSGRASVGPAGNFLGCELVMQAKYLQGVSSLALVIGLVLGCIEADCLEYLRVITSTQIT